MIQQIIQRFMFSYIKLCENISFSAFSTFPLLTLLSAHSYVRTSVYTRDLRKGRGGWQRSNLGSKLPGVLQPAAIASFHIQLLCHCRLPLRTHDVKLLQTAMNF